MKPVFKNGKLYRECSWFSAMMTAVNTKKLRVNNSEDIDRIVDEAFKHFNKWHYSPKQVYDSLKGIKFIYTGTDEEIKSYPLKLVLTAYEDDYNFKT